MNIFLRSRPRHQLQRFARVLRLETVGGLLLVAAAVVAMIWANSPWATSYFALRDVEVGVASLGLQLSLGAWAADGLLAVFFFMVGLELKREFVEGDLRNIRTALVPVAAAFGGVLVPAVIYVSLVSGSPGLNRGWAIPTATDIAFAVAVLAIIGSHLPGALRIFLLTLAVVDDLVAIAIIAIFYTDDVRFAALGAAALTVIVYGFIAQKYRALFGARPFAAWLILLPIGVIAWVFMHQSGVHATIAGVLLAFTVPVRARRGHTDAPGEHGLATEFEHRFRPLSAGVAVPVFAFFAAGVSLGGSEGVGEAMAAPVTLAIIAALVIGKPLGITCTAWLVTKITKQPLDSQVRWIEMIGVGLLAGIGFTVSLLVTELSFPTETDTLAHAKVAVMTASVVAAAAAATILVPRNFVRRRAFQASDRNNFSSSSG